MKSPAARFQEVQDHRFRLRAAIIVVSISVVFGLGTWAQRANVGSIRESNFLLPGLLQVVCLLTLLAIWRRFHERMVARFALYFGTGLIIYSVGVKGGLLGAETPSLAILPVVCAFAFGSRDTLFFGCFAILGVFGLYFAHDGLPPFHLNGQEEALRTSLIAVMTCLLIGFAIVVSIMRESERRNAQLTQLLAQQRHDARHDALTGLPNRLALNQFLEGLTPADGRYEILLLDLDGFKTVNDTAGHDTGDQLLITAAERMRQIAPDADLIARLGGDEFVIINRLDPEKGATLGPSLAQDMKLTVAAPGRTCPVTASIGGAVFPVDDDDVSAVMSKADKALYAVKRAGKAGYLGWAALRERKLTA